MVSTIGRGFFAIGRVLGVASALVVLALLSVLALGPASEGVGPGTLLVLALTGLLAVVAAVASIVGSPGALLIVFLLSFFPVGLYLLGAPSIFKWVGVAELGYLASATALYYGGSNPCRRTNH